MAEVFDGLLVACPNDGGMFLFNRGVMHRLDDLDTTGLASSGGMLVRALQPDRLAMLGTAARELEGAAGRFDDLHDVLLDGEHCYVVSTRHNEILKLDMHGAELDRWTFPGEPDSWHINCMARWNDRIVFSAFCDRVNHRGYKEPPLDVGFVQDLRSGERLITGLSQPHSLMAVDGHLLLANSGAFELHEYDENAALVRKRALDGYTRGIARQDSSIFVGISKTRNVEAGGPRSAQLVALDAGTWQEVSRRVLPVDEIYSIQTLRGEKSVDSLAKISAHASATLSAKVRVAKSELAVAKEELAAGNSRIQQLSDELADSRRQVFGLLETIHGKDIHIQNRDALIERKDAQFQSRDAIIESREEELRARGDLIARKDAELKERDAIIESKEEQLRMRDELIERKDAELKGREVIIESKEEQLRMRDELIERKDVELQGRDAIIESKEAQILACNQLIEEKDNRLRLSDTAISKLQAESGERLALIERLTQQLLQSEQESVALERSGAEARNRVSELQECLTLIQRSRSWRVTAPLRSMGRGARSLRRTLGAIAYVGRSPLRYARLVRNLGLRGTVSAARGFVRRGGPQVRLDTASAPKPVFNLRLEPGQVAGILTTQHCLFIAELIADALRRVGIASEIVFERPPEGFRDVPHFVICPQMFEQLPGLYVAFQMEQSVSSRWFTTDYLRTLENSFAIFDYSIVNIKKLTAMGLSPRQFFYLPVGPLQGYGAAPDHGDDQYEYDVIFYGDVNNARRQAFLAALEKVCRVKIVGNLFGDELHRELRKARMVVNIHYYEGALLETTRLWECLSLGKFVISERSSDMSERGDLASLIDFVDVGDVEGMVGRVRHWLGKADELERRIHANNEAIASSCSGFDYFFYRFMLYSGNISFSEFWKLVGDKLPAPSEKLCLNLPEYVDRAEAFDKDNTHGFTRFAGLKHPYGWMGCALSYKFMAMWARKYGLKQLVVCEDDVEFPQGFDATWDQVSRHLVETGDEWDLFSGLLADLHEGANVLDSHEAGDVTYAVLDRMISTVYNVYGPKALDLIAAWDDEDYDVESNTIDRYLERCTQLRVMTTLPFMVGHKEELYSTLWGMQNTQYTKLIEASQELLARKVQAWRHRKRRRA
ncbi:MAG: DUF4915 domain-containing protein [Dyella sp.]|uniref:DUF4915 domain-containing protein n=1 Tax=Dyella sp. TaxID=1869338 RepID=UPI003F7F3F47